MKNIQEQFTQKLLVEGNNDQHIVWSLCTKLGLKQTFDVIDCGSIEQVLKQIPVRIKQAEIETLGIIVDADENLLSRWKEIKNILKKEGLDVGDLPENGLILQNEDKIKIGVWIMPNNNLAGMLEDFITFLVPKEDKLLPIVENHLN